MAIGAPARGLHASPGRRVAGEIPDRRRDAATPRLGPTTITRRRPRPRRRAGLSSKSWTVAGPRTMLAANRGGLQTPDARRCDAVSRAVLRASGVCVSASAALARRPCAGRSRDRDVDRRAAASAAPDRRRDRRGARGRVRQVPSERRVAGAARSRGGLARPALRRLRRSRPRDRRAHGHARRAVQRGARAVARDEGGRAARSC